MKIYYVSPSFYPAVEYGGPIFSTLHVCRELLKKGVSLDIHSTNVNRRDRLKVKTSCPVEVEELGGSVWYHRELFTDKFSLSLLKHMPQAIKEADLVHTQSVFSISTPASIIFSKIFGKPVVVSPRGSLGEWCVNQGSRFKKIWLNLFFKPFLENIYWHVTAEAEKKDVLRVFPSVRDENFLIIPNGINRVIDKPVSKELLEDHLAMEIPESYILSIGRIDKKKGFDFTIRSLEYLDNSLHLIIAGADYGEKDELISLAEKLGLKKRVHFIGQVDGSYKATLYKKAKVFVLNSRHENFGNVYLESLSYGTPIIASDNTPWEFITEEKAGYCVPNDPELIAENVLSVIDMVNNDGVNLEARCAKVASSFFWDNIAEFFVKEYERVKG